MQTWAFLIFCLYFYSSSANSKLFFPAPWLDGKNWEQHPVNIWYWVRERSSAGSSPTTSPTSSQRIQVQGNTVHYRVVDFTVTVGITQTA